MATDFLKPYPLVAAVGFGESPDEATQIIGMQLKEIRESGGSTSGEKSLKPKDWIIGSMKEGAEQAESAGKRIIEKSAGQGMKEVGHLLETSGIHGKRGLGIFDRVDRWDSVRAAYDNGGTKAAAETATKEGVGLMGTTISEEICRRAIPVAWNVLAKIASADPAALVEAAEVSIPGAVVIIVTKGWCGAKGDSVGKSAAENIIMPHLGF